MISIVLTEVLQFHCGYRSVAILMVFTELLQLYFLVDSIRRVMDILKSSFLFIAKASEIPPKPSK